MNKTKEKIEQQVDTANQIAALQRKLSRLEKNRKTMNFEDYIRESSILQHKIECLQTRKKGEWHNDANVTYGTDTCN